MGEAEGGKGWESVEEGTGISVGIESSESRDGEGE